MRESRSYGSVGERGGNEPLYPEYYKDRTYDIFPGESITLNPHAKYFAK